MVSAPLLSVVVPVRNEADNILPLIEEIHAALTTSDGTGRWEFEVIYVDDGSTDATPAKLAEAQARFPRLRVLRHKASCGQSTAIWTAAHAARGQWIVTLDGDGQNDPADIPAMVDVAVSAGPNLNLVAGIRRKRQDVWLKRISSRLANGIRQKMLRDGVRDTGCGLKVMRRDAFVRLPYFDHMHRYYPALMLRGGGLLQCHDVNHRARMRGVSNYGFFDRLWVGITDLFGVAWLLRRAKQPVVEYER
ncbi:MAG TPA: glycosyltransferase family 2 protein [Alphaproteobacteria bacterium]|jgi:dolichol-phosphate mannosyltransferase